MVSRVWSQRKESKSTKFPEAPATHLMDLEGWKTESTLESPSTFEPWTLWIWNPSHISFSIMFYFYTSWKTENRRFYDVFRGYRSGTLVENGWSNFIWSQTLISSRPNPGRKEEIKLNFYFQTSLWCLKRFYEGLKKAFIKPFEALQRSVKKIKFFLKKFILIQLSEVRRTEMVKG